VVEFTPAQPSFKIGDNEANLTCRLDRDSESIQRVFWYKNNALLKASPGKYVIEGGQLRILQVQADDKGRYVCKVRVGSSYVRGRVNVEVTGRLLGI